MRDSPQIRATRGYLHRLLTKRERKKANALIRHTHKMVGATPTNRPTAVLLQPVVFKGETYVTR